MTPLDSLNKFLHEKVMGECWHEQTIHGNGLCRKCSDKVFLVTGRPFPPPDGWTYPDYSQDEHYLKLVRKFKEDKQIWADFIAFLIRQRREDESLWDIVLNPSLGSRALAEYRGWKERLNQV